MDKDNKKQNTLQVEKFPHNQQSLVLNGGGIGVRS
jgi:hypothetical protein